MLKLMYITNSPEVASIADGAGVDRISSISNSTAKRSARKTGIP